MVDVASEKAGLDAPCVDLEQIILPLENLSSMPLEFAQSHRILPLLVEKSRICLAMDNPRDLPTLEAVTQLTGRQVLPYGVMHGSLGSVIEESYKRRDRGEEYYVGPKVTAEDLSPFHLQESSESEDSLLPSALHRRTPQGQPRRLLIADAQEDLRRLLRRVFLDKGYEVVEAAAGEEALELLAKRLPDLLLVDAVLPGIHGLDICRRVKANPRTWHIPIIVVSAAYRGWRIAEDLRESYSVHAFLEKPFKVSAVANAVEKALRGTPPGEDDAEEEVLSRRVSSLLAESLESYQSGDIDTAIGKLQEGIVSEPFCYKLHYHLGLLYGRRDQLIEAIEALEAAIELRPRNFAALKNLAVLYQRAGFKRQSIEMWERALISVPDVQTHREIREHLIRLL